MKKTHNLLQRVAFVKNPQNYVDPAYPAVDLRDRRLITEMKTKVQALKLPLDTNPIRFQVHGNPVTITAEQVARMSTK